MNLAQDGGEDGATDRQMLRLLGGALYGLPEVLPVQGQLRVLWRLRRGREEGVFTQAGGPTSCSSIALLSRLLRSSAEATA